MRRLDEVVQGFLRFIRPENLRLDIVPVASIVEAILPIVKAEADHRRVQLEIDVPRELPDIRVDSAMMQQALLNLAINACQAMPDGGRLRLAAAPASQQRIEITCEDTGHGIPPEHLDQIFNLYFTTKEGGSGIGLSMVYRTVQLHDGELNAVHAGRGTKFRLLLPRRDMSDNGGSAPEAVPVPSSCCRSPPPDARGCLRGPPVRARDARAAAARDSSARVPIEASRSWRRRRSAKCRRPRPRRSRRPALPPRHHQARDARGGARGTASRRRASRALTPEPLPSLQSTANPTAAEQRTRAALVSAQRDLARIDVRTLSADARAQYDHRPPIRLRPTTR